MNRSSVVAEWRRKVEALHQELELPWQRYRFAEALLERAEELEAVGDFSALTLLEKRLDLWMERQREYRRTTRATASAEVELFQKSWRERSFSRELQECRERLKRFKKLIPRGERRLLSEELTSIEERCAENRFYGEEMERLRRLRQGLITRCFRSLQSIEQRGVEALTPVYPRSEIPVGPYNNRAILSDLLGMISQTDPIWAGDLIDLYGSLNRLSHQLD